MKSINITEYKRLKDINKDIVVLEKENDRIIIYKKDLNKKKLEPQMIREQIFKKRDNSIKSSIIDI